MSTELTRTGLARRRWAFETNTISFPTTLRDAIPELPTCDGRVLKLDSIDGTASDSELFGKRIRLRMLAKETGKLMGEFPILVDLDPEAALALAETLTKLAKD